MATRPSVKLHVSTQLAELPLRLALRQDARAYSYAPDLAVCAHVLSSSISLTIICVDSSGCNACCCSCW